MAIHFYLLLVCSANLGFAQSSIPTDKYQYISPIPGSKFNNIESTLIFKVWSEQKDIKENSIKVTGSKSGEIHGEIIFSDDEQTIIFKPSTRFSFGEIITVNINEEKVEKSYLLPSISYKFRITETDYALLDLDDYTEDFQKNTINPSTGIDYPGMKKSRFSVNDSLPEGFPEIITQVYNDPLPGYHFFSPNNLGFDFLIICDNFGTPVFYRRMTRNTYDFEIQPTGILTYSDKQDRCFYGMDEQYNVIDTFNCGNGYSLLTDMHELRVRKNGHYFLFAYDPQLVNMDTVVSGGNPEAVVTGLIIQELDINDHVVFQWRSWDHFKITDAIYWINMLGPFIDYVHGNAIEIDSDTSILISSRSMNEITKIDRRTGEIIWRLNGENNQFTFINDTIRFFYQHSVRLMPDSSHISIYDNGLGHIPTRFSSALEYEINEQDMTATLIKRLSKTPIILGSFMGNVQRHQGGQTTIGWGFIDTSHTTGYSYIPAITEFKADYSVALEISYPYESYRAFKFDWRTTALRIEKNEILFDSIPINDSSSTTVYITNNTDKTMVINRILKHNSDFTCNNNPGFSIAAGDSLPLTFTFKPTADTIYEDVYTFCCDTYENDINQRIACQVHLKGNPNTGITSDIFFRKDIVKVYPNPAESFLNILLEEDIDLKGIFYNLSGQRITEFHLEKGINYLNVSYFKSGVYLLKIIDGKSDSFYFEKVVIK